MGVVYVSGVCDFPKVYLHRSQFLLCCSVIMNEQPKNWTSVVDGAASNWTTIMEPPDDENLFLKCTVTFGYILSSMAISVHLFVHISTDLFRNFPGNLLVSNCVLLFIQYCFSISFLVLANHNTDSIFNRDAVRRYDYYVTMYIWSVLTRVQFAMAFDLWKCLKTQTTNARLSKQRTLKFIKYSVCCWSSPFVEWACLWLLNKYALKNVECWFCSQNSTWTIFMMYYVTDFALMILNFILYIICLYYIYQTTSSIKGSHRQSSNFLFYFKICGRLFIMSEVNYTLLIFVNHFELYFLRLIFNNFMAYHGAIVFATIVFQKSILKYQGSRADTENTATLQMTG